VGEGKKMLDNEKYWNKPPICEYNITHCTGSYWILGEHSDREWVTKEEKGLIW
jgi:hypothetical protein